MNPITSVLQVPKQSGKKKPATKAQALAAVRKTSQRVRDDEREADEHRVERNDAICDAAEFAPATEIAEAAEIKQSYISRVIRSGGRPGSGTAIERARDGETARA